MYTETQLARYLAEIRDKVCSRCRVRPPGAPPCAPHGRYCGIELNLPRIVDLSHQVQSETMNPLIERFHTDLCSLCAIRLTKHCPCPVDYLLLLATKAIEAVDRREAELANG
jgi:hypothetical protein